MILILFVYIRSCTIFIIKNKVYNIIFCSSIEIDCPSTVSCLKTRPWVSLSFSSKHFLCFKHFNFEYIQKEYIYMKGINRNKTKASFLQDMADDKDIDKVFLQLSELSLYADIIGLKNGGDWNVDIKKYYITEFGKDIWVELVTYPYRGFFRARQSISSKTWGSIINQPFNIAPQANSVKRDIHLSVGDHILLAEGGTPTTEYLMDKHLFQVLSSKSDAESLFKEEKAKEKEKEKEDHVLSHSSEEGGFITLADVK
ncbi:hypothetical protein RFI_34697 [Reticulomyxa filosa]|uniref:Uncharacterized protein n=1 Tax=Reticulomyxa filosa TaxID=46433 RepID=X6LMV5_RETFI|nr:hypothetical protein RFI_34697 [Reticulomyxa filosa]|eukprot:ETO02716.1 hypothetical protein RFI_34697 [Reticulomyxa filosa]